MPCRWSLMTILVLVFTVEANAWGPTGHRVVAEIAERHLTTAARERVEHLLGGHSLAEMANWADELRSEKRFDKYKRLHFATVPNGVKSYRDATKDPCGDLVAAIGAVSTFLRTGSRDDLFAVKALTDKSDGKTKGACNPVETDPISPDTALRLLVHFMGDLHQPLHVGGTDLGGNTVAVSWLGHWQTNLHSTWDDEMIDYERLGFSEYARFLDHVSDTDAARWQMGDTVTWADEAVTMRSQLYAFPDVRRPSTPVAVAGAPAVPNLVSYGYIGAQSNRMREQLLKGGLRLAGVLNTIFE